MRKSKKKKRIVIATKKRGRRNVAYSAIRSLNSRKSFPEKSDAGGVFRTSGVVLEVAWLVGWLIEY